MNLKSLLSQAVDAGIINPNQASQIFLLSMQLEDEAPVLEVPDQ